MCTALVQAKFTDKNVKLLDLSGTQAVVLLAFNEGPVAVTELQEITGLSDTELKKALISLSIPQQQILKIVDSDEAPKMSEGEGIPMSKKKSIKMNFTKSDQFQVNKGFRSNKKRIQVNSSLQKKEQRQDSDSIHEKVLNERKYHIDAVVVKTMKGRKTLSETELMTEIIRLLKFPCDIDTIQKRIKGLIEGQYMRIDDNDSKMYHYIA